MLFGDSSQEACFAIFSYATGNPIRRRQGHIFIRPASLLFIHWRHIFKYLRNIMMISTAMDIDAEWSHYPIQRNVDAPLK